MEKCKISEIIPLDSNKVNPTIAYFENGDLLPEGAKKLKCFYAKNTTDKNSRQTIAVSDNNVFYGKTGHRFADDLQRTFVAIRNKSTNKMRLIEVEQCLMQSQYFDGQSDEKVQLHNRTVEQSQKLLIDNFGNKNAKRMFERNTKRQYNADLVESQLNRTFAAMTEKGLDIEDDFDKARKKREEFLESMTPTSNKNATILSEVYQLNDLIDDGVLNRIDDEAIEVLKSDDFSFFKNSFIVNILNTIKRSKEPDSVSNLTKVKICIYMDAMINFLAGLKNRHMNMEKLNFSLITKKVEVDIRNKFTQPHDQKLSHSKYVVHKLSSYIIILSLLISEKYQINIEDISQALKSSQTDLLKILSSIAVRYNNKTKIISLQLPSKLPPPKDKFRRKQRSI